MGFGKNGRGAILRENVLITVGGLAANTGILANGGSRISDNLQDDFRILKTEIALSKVDQTSDEASLYLYMVDGELTLAEAAASIQNGGPLDRNDNDQRERAERWVKPICSLQASSDITTAGGPLYQLPIVVKPGWTFSNPEAWDWMVFNQGATSSGAALVRMFVTHYGVWVT